jgi:quaternary ammonium compound-resistance protein SugE
MCEELSMTITSTTAWLLLLLAGLLEIAWAVGLKYADGFTRPWPSVATLAAMALSMYLLALAAKTLPIGTAYAVWTGIGTVGAASLGIALFHESHDWKRLACIALIIAGIVGLRIFK